MCVKHLKITDSERVSLFDLRDLKSSDRKMSQNINDWHGRKADERAGGAFQVSEATIISGCVHRKSILSLSAFRWFLSSVRKWTDFLCFYVCAAGEAEEEVLLLLQEPGDRAGQRPVRSWQPPGGGQHTHAHVHAPAHSQRKRLTFIWSESALTGVLRWRSIDRFRDSLNKMTKTEKFWIQSLWGQTTKETNEQ